jgi:hypothetical protein
MRTLAVSACVEWPGHKDAGGYGWVGTRKYGTRLAHRVAWIKAHGPVPTDVEVCHRCDTPSCVNVDHLFLGTHAENIGDMVSKGRHANQVKEVCPQCGGEYKVNSQGRRVCLPCHAAWKREWRAARKAVS